MSKAKTEPVAEAIVATPSAAATGQNIPPTLSAVQPDVDPRDTAAGGNLFLIKRVIVYQGPGPLHNQHIYPQDNLRLTFDHLSGAELALLLKRGIIAPA